jgi:antitoxin MazE
MTTSTGRICVWGNGFALRLTQHIVETAGVVEGSPVRITVRLGRIVIESELEPTLAQMLAAFNPRKHGGEVMADHPRPVPSREHARRIK